jgi:hypothetical protein
MLMAEEHKLCSTYVSRLYLDEHKAAQISGLRNISYVLDHVEPRNIRAYVPRPKTKEYI